MAKTGAQVFFETAKDFGLPNTFFDFKSNSDINNRAHLDELKNSRDLFITDFFNMFNPSISKVIKKELFYMINFTTKDADSGTLTIANQNGIFGANQIHQKIKIRITSRPTQLSHPKII